MILYNCHHDGDQYRITKFDDGEPRSSYLCTTAECECPGAHRDTCRHRQMLPIFIDQGLINTHWFLAWDNGKQIVDLLGHLYVAPAEPAPAPVPLRFDMDCTNNLGHGPAFALLPAKPWRRI